MEEKVDRKPKKIKRSVTEKHSKTTDINSSKQIINSKKEKIPGS